MKGYRCVGPCLPAISAVAIENTSRLWSLNTSWSSGKVPLAGEDVVIEPGQNFIYDLEDSPVYNYVQINGRVTFMQDAPKLRLNAKYIFVRTGELIVGNESDPFQGDAQITLYGEKNNQHIVYDNAIEAGNKILANTGLLSVYGKRRISRSRLLKSAQRGDTSITVSPGLSWNETDKIGLTSTTMNWNELDYAVIKSYDNVTGVVTLDRPLSDFHFGKSESTGA
jgi:hypothetical protein